VLIVTPPGVVSLTFEQSATATSGSGQQRVSGVGYGFLCSRIIVVVVARNQISCAAVRSRRDLMSAHLPVDHELLCSM